MLTAKGAVKAWISLQLCLFVSCQHGIRKLFGQWRIFNGFNSDDINDYHDNANELNDSDLDILSIGSSDNDDGQSDIDILSVESSDDNDDTASESSIESTGENGNDDGEQ